MVRLNKSQVSLVAGHGTLFPGGPKGSNQVASAPFDPLQKLEYIFYNQKPQDTSKSHPEQFKKWVRMTKFSVPSGYIAQEKCELKENILQKHFLINHCIRIKETFFSRYGLPNRVCLAGGGLQRWGFHTGETFLM